MSNRLYKFSRRLKKLRESRGWSMETLADKLGTTKSNIHYYENMHRAPGFDMILKMVELFDESADYIMGVSDVPCVKKMAN